jgi:phosphoglycolate phosphatase-like HAD superfamily hydrolase
MRDWMHALAEHYDRCRVAHPGDRLLVVFDIDGTILDMRHMVSHVLAAFDREHGTHLFDGLRPEDVDVHENEVEALLDRRQLPPATRQQVLEWYHQQRWAPESVLVAHRPFRGVLEVIRWFQIQPKTSVALNTGRPASLHDATLRSLNELGREYKVSFTDDLLFMNPEGWEVAVPEHKVEGIRSFQEAGYRVVAVVDNEPAILEALAAVDTTHEILFLHAETLYQSGRRSIPRTVGGRDWAITSLVGERDLPRHVQLVWHGVNDDANLRQFVASPIRWGEVDVRRHPRGGLVLRHDAFDPSVPVASYGSPPSGAGAGTNGTYGADVAGAERRTNGGRRAVAHRGDRSVVAGWDPAGGAGRPAGDVGRSGLLTLERALAELRAAGKGVKLDLKQDAILDEVLATVAAAGTSDDDLWFNGRLDVLGDDGVRAIRAAHPGAVIQCPVDFLTPLAAAMPGEALRLLQNLTSWGVSRFSVGWAQGRGRELFERLDGWGYEVNLYAVPDLEQFLQAVLMVPRSITADFNFPEWHYFGRGAGHGGHYHRYSVVPVPHQIDSA